MKGFIGVLYSNIRDSEIIVGRFKEPVQKTIMLTHNKPFSIPQGTLNENMVTFKHNFRPKPHQKTLVDKLVPIVNGSKGAYLIYWEMGSGKTLAVLNVLRHCPFPEPQKVIVICPKSVVWNWYDEIKRLSFLDEPQKDRFLIFHIMCESQLRTKLQKKPDFLRGQIVIYDEVHTLRNLTPTGEQIIDAVRGASVKILLTGTPLVNDPSETDYLSKITDTRVPFETSYAGRIDYFKSTEMSTLVKLDPVRVPMTYYQTFRYFEKKSSQMVFGDTVFIGAIRNSYDTRRKVTSLYVNDDHAPKITDLIKNIKKFGFP